MTFITGIKAAQEKTARPERQDFADRPKTVWASLKSDGDSSKVIPLQELDEGSPNYSEKNGLGLFALEHSNPDDFRKNALCTIDDGGCYACEKGWYQKVVLYLNVLFDAGTKDERVAVLSKGTGKGSVGKVILSIAADEEYSNSITDKAFKFSREGKGTDTSYSFSPLPKAHDKNVEDYADQLFDLKLVPFKVAYEKQEAYYNGEGFKKADSVETKKAPLATAAVGVEQDQDW